MTENDRLSPADLAGAYALDAVSAAEATEFEAHLESSEEARIEAAELSDTAVALGMATTPVQPSAALKAGLMAQLATTPQLPPLTGPLVSAPVSAPSATGPSTSATPGATPGAGPSGPSPAAGQPATREGDALAHRDDATQVRDAGPAAGATSLGTGVTSTPEGFVSAGAGMRSGGGPAEQRARARWFQRPAVVIASAAAAAALFFGGVVANQALTNNQFEEQQATALAEINAAPDAQRASTVTSNGHPATLVWSGKLGLSALLIEDLPPLPSDKDYQLWYMNEGGAFSAGTFDSPGRGTVWRVLEGTMHAGDEVGVTVEPKGGSKEPTSDPIVAIQS